LICYASRTGTRRNLAALREAGWRLLVSRSWEWRTEGFRYALDSGAWTDHQLQRPFDDDAFERLIDKLGPGADWIELPDIVAGGRRSLDLSLRWSNRCRSLCDLVLIAVQDGIEPEDMENIVGPHVGIFLGGSTEWKLRRMEEWGAFCARRGCWYHVARVNTRCRIRLAHAAGANSFDGSSASRFAVTLPDLQRWVSQPDLLSPRASSSSASPFRPRGPFSEPL
jgi:hypothetical protein